VKLTPSVGSPCAQGEPLLSRGRNSNDTQGKLWSAEAQLPPDAEGALPHSKSWTRDSPLPHHRRGVGGESGKRVRPTAHSPSPAARERGDEGGEGLVHIHAIDVQPICADGAVNDKQVLRLRAAAEVEQHGQQVGVVHSAVAVDIHRRVAGAEREQNRQ